MPLTTSGSADLLTGATASSVVAAESLRGSAGDCSCFAHLYCYHDGAEYLCTCIPGSLSVSFMRICGIVVARMIDSVRGRFLDSTVISCGGLTE